MDFPLLARAPMKNWIGPALAVLYLVGCSSLPPLDLFELPGGKALKASVKAPDAAKLGVAVAYSAQEWAKSKEDFGHAVRLSMDGKHVRADFARTLGSLGLFQAVQEVGPEAAHEDSGDYLEEARRLGLDLLLVIKPLQNRVAYKGHGSMYAPSLALWILFWFPSWWVADEIFASEVAFEGSLFRVNDGRRLHQANWKGSFETALDDFQRNWRIWGILRIPGALDTEDYEQVGQILSPHAMNLSKIKAMNDLVGFVRTKWPALRSRPKPPEGTKPVKPALPDTGPGNHEEKTPKPPRETPKPVLPVRKALIIGAGDYRKELVPPVRFAHRDAEVFAGFLEKKGGFAKKDLTVLVGSEATTKAVREALEAFAAKPGNDEDLRVVYFSGRGMARPSGSRAQLFLSLYDTDPAGPAGNALSIDDLADILSACKGRVRLVLDTSFSGARASRGLGEAVPGAQEALDGRFGKRKGWAVLYGSGEGGGALELEELPGGIFTHFLIEGLGGEADGDGKDGVTFPEIRQYLSQNVTSTADLLGESQSPFAGTGDEGANVIP